MLDRATVKRIVEHAKTESLHELAATCQDVFAGRESALYRFPVGQHVHKSELPKDGKSTPWPMWLRIARVINEWPPVELKISDVGTVTDKLYDPSDKGQNAEYRMKTRDHMKSVAEFAIHRARILTLD